MKVYAYPVPTLLALSTAAVQRVHAALAMVSTNSVDLGQIYPDHKPVKVQLSALAP